MRDFKGKTAVVTGAASGIGHATAERMLAAGAHVALVDSDFDALVPAAEGLAKGRKERVLMIVADVRDEEQVKAAIAAFPLQIRRPRQVAATSRWQTNATHCPRAS